MHEASVPAEGKELVAGRSDLFGFVPNLGYAMAAEPVVLDVYLKMLQALGRTSFDPIAQQVALAAAGRANASEYAIVVHATLAEKLGASAGGRRPCAFQACFVEGRRSQLSWERWRVDPHQHASRQLSVADEKPTYED